MLGPGAALGPGAKIGIGAALGPGTKIGTGAAIGPGVKIGLGAAMGIGAVGLRLVELKPEFFAKSLFHICPPLLLPIIEFIFKNSLI